MKKNDQPILHDKGVSYVLPFILITFCFALWGFANDITNPMVKAFSKIFRMSVTDGALVQVAFYGGYFAIHSQVPLQSRYPHGIGLICYRCLSLPPGQMERRILSLLDSLFHSHLRTLVFGNQRQSLYSLDGQ